MFINSSSALSDVPPVSASSSLHLNSSTTSKCPIASDVIFTIFTIANTFFLFPLYIFIFYTGFQRWRHRHNAPAGTTMSHSDFFTYNVIIVEMFVVFGSILCTLGTFTNSIKIKSTGGSLFENTFPGQTVFHMLTCVERYLAVVHPITYMRLRETHGVKIRNIITVCVWVQNIGWYGILWSAEDSVKVLLLLAYSDVCLVVIIFCCLSVLHVLIRPGPGEVREKKERIDQSKQRAFHMIVVIMGALLLKFASILISSLLQTFSWMDLKDLCLVWDVVNLLSVPSSLVLPLLFLHRAKKLLCCATKTESG